MSHVPSKLRISFVTVIVTFDAKKAKETLMMRLSGSTITTTETTTFARLEKICLVKTPLNPWVLKTHQNVHLYQSINQSESIHDKRNIYNQI